MLIQTISHKAKFMSCKECKRSCRASLLCAACEKREHAIFEELGTVASKRANDQIWDSILTQDTISSATAATNGPSPLAAAMPVLESLVECRKELDEKFKQVPFRPAYLVMPPELYSQLRVPMTLFADDSDANYASARMDFRVFQDYGFRVQPYSPILYSDIGGSEPRVHPVVWKDVEQPTKPSAMIWCVVVAFLCWLMCAAAVVL